MSCWILILHFALAGEAKAPPSAPIVVEFSSERSCWIAYTAIVSEYLSHRFKAEILGGCYAK